MSLSCPGRNLNLGHVVWKCNALTTQPLGFKQHLLFLKMELENCKGKSVNCIAIQQNSVASAVTSPRISHHKASASSSVASEPQRKPF
ncbi:hypothetical protein TNCV_3938461 [Trichonephila clavipes]|nr:hypothetical protein TNCV_3938461 [Trichonephila clavipes]